MSENITVKVKNLSKNYRIYTKPVDRLKETFSLSRKKYHEEYNALKDVSFEIFKGETIGIVGKNGSGKSTLLKAITGVISPSMGEIMINGKISALLELGAGFNPEFTGIENIYLNGTIMGFTKEEMDEKVDDIINFADIGEFIYQPVRIYSSGMFARLAFAVSISVEPDILIVDEALSVGDMAFQHKCMHKMKQMIENGVTVLFVSHDTNAIKSLCKRCLYLENGSLKAIGEASEVIDLYLKDLRTNIFNIKTPGVEKETSIKQQKESKTIVNPLEDLFIVNNELLNENKYLRYGNGNARLRNIHILNNQGEVATNFYYNENMTLKLYIEILDDINKLNCSVLIKDKNGIDICGTTTFEENINFSTLATGNKLIVDFSFKNVFKGDMTYSISVAINDTESLQSQEVLDHIENVYSFKSIFNPERPVWYTFHHNFDIEYGVVNE